MDTIRRVLEDELHNATCCSTAAMGTSTGQFSHPISVVTSSSWRFLWRNACSPSTLARIRPCHNCSRCLLRARRMAACQKLSELVDFTKCDQFVNIGCGPFPAAALLIHEQTTVPRIIAIDNDRVTVDLASEVIRRLASPRLEVIPADGISYDFTSADVIYISNHVVPKAKIMTRVAETMPSSAKILIREPCGVGMLLAEQGCGPLPTPLQRLEDGVDDTNFTRNTCCAGWPNVRKPSRMIRGMVIRPDQSTRFSAA